MTLKINSLAPDFKAKTTIGNCNIQQKPVFRRKFEQNYNKKAYSLSLAKLRWPYNLYIFSTRMK